MIRFLLAATSLEPRLSTGECHAFASTSGTPQGDSLSPVLFRVYLEAALRDLRSRLPPRPAASARLQLNVEYADGIDFISYSRPYPMRWSTLLQLAWQSGRCRLMQPRREKNGPVQPASGMSTRAMAYNTQTRLPTWRCRRRGPPNATGKMPPSTKCGQFGSEGDRLAFICGYVSTQHSSCLYLTYVQHGHLGLDENRA